MNIGVSGSSSRKVTTSDSSGDKDPWAPVIPYLEDFLKKVGSAGPTGVTADQNAAFDQLKTTAGAGNPWAGDQRSLTNDLYATPDRTGDVSGAYSALENRIGKYADGPTDPMLDPGFKSLIDQVGTDAQNRINAQFAGAGRDLSGADQMATGRGVTQATLPVMVDQYNRNRTTQIGTSGQLYDAKVGGTTASAGLDAARAALRGSAAGAGDTALGMENYAPNSTLAIDQQRKMLPYEDLATLGSLLFPAAGLGEQQTQTGKSTTKGTQFGAQASATFIPTPSDERIKEDIQQIGEMADGTPLYRYRYKGDAEVRVGPMAQDVEQTKPGAVAEDAGGVKMVNMDAATRKAAQIVKQRRGGK